MTNFSIAALEMRRYLQELDTAHSYTVHLIVKELANRIVDAQSVEELIKVFKDVDYDSITHYAIQALVTVGNDLVIDGLIQALADPEAEKAVAAAKALGQIRSQRTVQPLREALQHPDGDVRAIAAIALGKIGDPSALEPLIHQLRDVHWHARTGAAEALSKMADEHALEPLVTAFYQCDLDSEELFPCFIVQALGRINTQESIEALLNILTDGRLYEDIHEEAMLSLGRIGNKIAFEPLVNAMNQRDLQAAGAKALGLLGDIRAVDMLLPLLAHTRPDVRGNAARALGLLKDRRALPYLKKMSQTDKEYYAAGIRLSDIANETIERIEQNKL